MNIFVFHACLYANSGVLFVWLPRVLTRHGEVDLLVVSYLLYAMYDIGECVDDLTKRARTHGV